MFKNTLMFHLKYLIFIFLLNPYNLSAQKYRSINNPHYWKNKKPFSDYWQQDVHYRIKAYLDEKNEIIQGKETIKYYNNSPDTLKNVFFNLYQNAFLDSSHLHGLTIANGLYPKLGKWEKEQKGNEILSIKVNRKSLKYEIDNSIMKVILNE